MLCYNQQQHIEECIKEDNKCFPPEFTPNTLDVFVKKAFTLLNTCETPKLVFGSMEGPLGKVGDKTVISRAQKIRLRLPHDHPDFARQYAENMHAYIMKNMVRIEEKTSDYVYYFIMWRPIYGIYRNCGGGLTHYAQTVVYTGEAV
jgi:hypothetical protein